MGLTTEKNSVNVIIILNLSPLIFFFFLTISFLFSFVASLLPFTKRRALGPGEGHGREKKSSIAIVIVISRPSKKLKNVRVVCDRTQVILFKMQIYDNHDLVIV